HPELPVEPFLHVTALLVADERDRAAVERPEAGDEGAVVRAAAIAVQLDPVVEDPLHVVERVRPVLVTRELDRAPDRLVGRVRLQSFELALEAFGFAVDARTAKERQPREPGQPVPQVDLLILLAQLRRPANSRNRRD